MMLSPLMMEQDKPDGSPGPGTSREANFLGDLGKPTMRGIRKCSKCGLLNGTRGTRCKNPKCGMLFKNAERLKPTGPEAVKLITDPGIQIYSVRTKTGDTRGFVQLPIVQDLEGNPAVVDVGIVCSAAKCYVETCGRAKNDGLDPCFHIRSSVEALEEATPLSFKNSILNSLPISGEMRQQIWAYATEKPGPLVQRVSKHMMVVKTAVTSKNPLGYLHFTFLPGKKEEKRFVCSCKESKMGRVTMSESESGAECVYKIQRCVHFYACVVAFASDEQLSKEFKFAIDADNEVVERTVVSGRVEIESSVIDQHNSEVENSVATDSVTDPTITMSAETELAGKSLTEVRETGAEVVVSSDSHMATAYVQSNSSPSKRQVSQPNAYVVPFPGSATKRFKPETTVVLRPQVEKNHRPFMKWLHFATERINASVHYSLPGNPRPLEFFIPQVYWDHLLLRMSPGTYSKSRLPNQSETITRANTPPLGTFNKYTWYITELPHLRKIFDTPEVALSVSKYFDRAPDGSYHLSTTPRVQVDAKNHPLGEQMSQAHPSDNHEYKTFLRVGKHGNQGLVSAFVIEWIPDLYPITGTGQLTFTFQYSHMIDGLAPEIETSSNYQQDPNMLIAHSPRELIIEQTEWVIENSDDTV